MHLKTQQSNIHWRSQYLGCRAGLTQAWLSWTTEKEYKWKKQTKPQKTTPKPKPYLISNNKLCSIAGRLLWLASYNSKYYNEWNLDVPNNKNENN